MQMSVSRRYKPPGCRFHPLAYPRLQPLRRFHSALTSRIGRQANEWERVRGGSGRRISGLNYQTGYPQRKPSETVPSSPNALERESRW